MLLEVCCTDMDAVRAAIEGGADRVELCVNIEEGGLTPPLDFVREAMATGIRVHVLIRPRPGNFVYNEAEAETMLQSIRQFMDIGVEGFVFGALTPDGEVDRPLCKRMLDASGMTYVTFHRAFDECRYPFRSFRYIERMGFDRILTSGQKATALEGAPLIHELVQRASSRIDFFIMAGSGINASNAEEVIRLTGVKEIHGTLREPIDGVLRTTARQVRMVKDICLQHK